MINKKAVIITIAVAITLMPVYLMAYAQLVDNIDTKDIQEPISETDNRKSFGYCPDASILDKYGVVYTIESCPLSRMYVDNWDKIDNTTKTNIVNELNNNGWRIEAE